jgi:hypothetical protein
MVRTRPNFEWQVAAVNRVQRLLTTVSAALDEAAIPYAVIGGNAVATWVATCDVGAVRATKDVDVLLRREDVARAAEVLAPLGFERADVLDLPVFVERDDPLPSQGVHVVLANEPVRMTDQRPAPDVTDVERSESGFLVLGLLPLVTMKLNAYRRVDQVHLEDLLRLGLIDAELVGKLPEDLRQRLREVRDTMEW